MTDLRIATNLALPIEAATESSAILARRGRGKTYCALVLAEELHSAGQPFVYLDPTGAAFGLRSSADGKSPGLPVTIIGGEHGDVPLEPTSGKLLATFVVDNPGAYVLDLSGLESNAAQDRFVTDFAERGMSGLTNPLGVSQPGVWQWSSRAATWIWEACGDEQDARPGGCWGGIR